MKEFPPFHLATVNQCLWRGWDRTDQERVLLTPRRPGACRAVSRAMILRLADSLPHDEPLRAGFLSAPAVRRIVDP
jgi:hypothetical protein